jgi:hypothetical protein
VNPASSAWAGAAIAHAVITASMPLFCHFVTAASVL